MATSATANRENSASELKVHSPVDHLIVNPVDFEQHFSKEPFLIDHNLVDHPLFDLSRIVELTQTLPAECIEYNAGNLPVSIDPELTPRNGLSPEETIRRIEECQSWIVLKYVELDPEYRALLNECLALLKPHTESIAPGMTQAQAFVFVTSPGSVTPYHIDPEHNFLLQIQGSKQVRMLDGRNKEIVGEVDLENFYSDQGRNLKFKTEHETTGWTYDLQAGKGLHFPVTYPHWVKNGDAVSISFSITFRTPDLDRRRALYQMNHTLRSKGRSPAPVGQHPVRDSIRYHAFRVLRKLKLS